jgi:hypothetical protein
LRQQRRGRFAEIGQSDDGSFDRLSSFRPPVPGNDAVAAIDDNRGNKSELEDRIGDLVDLLFGMCPGVSLRFLEAFERHYLDLTSAGAFLHVCIRCSGRHSRIAIGRHRNLTRGVYDRVFDVRLLARAVSASDGQASWALPALTRAAGLWSAVRRLSGKKVCYKGAGRHLFCI